MKSADIIMNDMTELGIRMVCMEKKFLFVHRLWGLADAYDALISPRPYKSKLTHGEALQMILNGECGSFSQPLLHCFLEAAMQKEWIKKADS